MKVITLDYAKYSQALFLFTNGKELITEIAKQENGTVRAVKYSVDFVAKKLEEFRNSL